MEFVSNVLLDLYLMEIHARRYSGLAVWKEKDHNASTVQVITSTEMENV